MKSRGKINGECEREIDRDTGFHRREGERELWPFEVSCAVLPCFCVAAALIK